MHLDYHNRKFAGVTNTANGQVSGDTIFHYQQHGHLLTGSYQGGAIRQGQLMGIVHEDMSLEFVYHHLDIQGTLRSGHCVSVPEILPDGRIRLHERWVWDYGGEGEGQSIVEEI